jgi:HMG (high mobility group) box
MMPRNPADGNPNMQQQQQAPGPYGQQYGGGGGRSNMSRGNGGGGIGPTGYPEQQGNSRRFTLSGVVGAGGRSPSMGAQPQQVPIHGGGMSMGGGGGGDMMGNLSQRSHHSQQQHQQSYRGDMASNSPNNPNSMAQAYYGAEQLSPTHFAHRMSLGFYPMSGGSAASPNFATMGDQLDLSGRGLPPTAPPVGGPGGQLTQADREEELLLNLLIARRQRGRMAGDGKGRSQASLAEELMRLRQSRAASGQQRSGSIPQMPGMPPLYADSMPAGAGVPPNMYPVSSMEAYHRGPSMKAEALPPHHQMRQIPDLSERIDRSPGRFQMTDARMSEMREMSERTAGFKRGMGMSNMGMGMPPMGYDSGFNYQTSLEMQGMDMMPPVKKKRTHKKKPADMPRRPLSAYNLFFSEERERILKEIEQKEGKDEGKEGEGGELEEKAGEGELEGDDGDKEEKPKALLRPLIPSQKKRRPHRKTHGKISFQQLARMVGERWKSLPEDERKYYQDLAQEDMKRQKVAMEEYYAKQNATKLKSGEVVKPGADEAPESPEESYADEAGVTTTV